VWERTPDTSAHIAAIRGKIVLTCRCILESANNEAAFKQPFVGAVMGAITFGRFDDRGLELVEAFDQLNLVGIWEQMTDLEYFYLKEAPSALERIVRNKLRRILSPPEPVKVPSKKEQAAADRQRLASSRAKVVLQNIELGCKLAALRDVTPSHKKFSWAVRKQFGIRDSLLVAELQRVARRYADRPDITGRVRNWRVLVELSSTALSESARRKLEEMILAGEKIDGAQIIKARGTVAPGRPARGPLDS